MGKWKDADEYANEVEVTALKVIKIIGFTILGIAFVVLVGFVVRWLWNWLMVDIFSLKAITYWQGIGILLLGRILFGGFGSSGSNKDDKKSPRGVISKGIKDGLHEEMQKEFKAEYARKYADMAETSCESNDTKESDDPSIYVSSDASLNAMNQDDNKEQEDLYEAWWQSEGEKIFEAYMDKRED